MSICLLTGGRVPCDYYPWRFLYKTTELSAHPVGCLRTNSCLTKFSKILRLEFTGFALQEVGKQSGHLLLFLHWGFTWGEFRISTVYWNKYFLSLKINEVDTFNCRIQYVNRHWETLHKGSCDSDQNSWPTIVWALTMLPCTTKQRKASTKISIGFLLKVLSKKNLIIIYYSLFCTCIGQQGRGDGAVQWGPMYLG